VRQPVERQGHPLRGEQEELLGADVPPALVDRHEQRGVGQVERGTRRAHLHRRPFAQQRGQLPLQVPADGADVGELAGDDRVRTRPRPFHLDRGVLPLAADGVEPVEQPPHGVVDRRGVVQQRTVFVERRHRTSLPAPRSAHSTELA
jgi:hypothetical protein